MLPSCINDHRRRNESYGCINFICNTEYEEFKMLELAKTVEQVYDDADKISFLQEHL